MSVSPRSNTNVPQETSQATKPVVPENATKAQSTCFVPNEPPTSPFNVPEHADGHNCAPIKSRGNEELMEVTKTPEVIDLTDDATYSVPTLASKEKAVKKELEEIMPSVESDAIVEEPQTDHTELDTSPKGPETDRTVPAEMAMGSKTDFMEVDAVPRDDSALSVLEGDDTIWQFDVQERAEETEDTMAMIQAAANSFRSSLPVNPPSTTMRNFPMDDVDMTDTAIDSDTEDAEATAKFADLNRVYMNKKKSGKLSDADEIEYSRASQAEEERKRRRARNKTPLAYPQRDEDSMFFSDDGRRSPIPGDDDDSLIAILRDENMGFEPNTKSLAGKGTGRKGRWQGLTSISKGGTRNSKVTKPKTTTKRGPKSSTLNSLNFGSIFNNDLIGNAQRNQEKGDQPTFNSKNKATALKELISSMPSDQRKLHQVDTAELLKASKMFAGRGAMRSDGAGGWKLKGMKSSLHHYQLLGTAFMRERETSSSRPFGGFVCDDMGLGKTIMALANVVDGRANAKSKARATLVVAPSSLVNQWMNEIAKHADIRNLGSVIQYRSGSRGVAADLVADFSNSFVVITSYSEVLRSWPKLSDPPAEIYTDRAIAEWRQEQQRTNVGELHQVIWRRIILDEAQTIKNHLSRTSQAVCQLKGKYRWALSGTPVGNRVEEFYSYFKFMDIPHTGTYETFRKNFCKRDSALSLKRLRHILSLFMLRRTHADQLFGRPILKLPALQSRTITVEFSTIEKTIYRIVKERFVHNVKAYVRTGSVEKKYQSIFVLLLRLRQLTAHCLLIQDTLKELLEESDLQRLWQLTEDESNADNQRLIQGLKVTLGSPTTDTSEGQQQYTGSRPITSRFRKYLQSLRDDGKWAEITDRTLCTSCKNAPTDPRITSCSHIYCFNCLNDLAWIAAQDNDKKGSRCLECGVYFDRAEPCSRDEMLTLDRGSPGSVHSGIKKRGTAKTEDTGTDWFSLPGSILQSAKTKAAIAQIEQWHQEDGNSKVIVFTQFQAMIKVMGRLCQENRWGYESFHGGMSFEARDKATKTFSTDPKCMVLLAGLKAGGVGLNLTAANRVIIIDLWWNQFVETQAFCRVYRIGQDREVDMVRIVVKDTVDEEILMMQENKNFEIDQVVESKNRPSRLSTDELLQLFAVDLERNDQGEPLVGANEEPFIITNDPYQQQIYAGDVSE